jgi:YopX protein
MSTYRVWDKAKKKMYHEDFPFTVFTQNRVLKLDPKLENDRYFIVEGDFEFMEFTGFIDANNEEIFEGDVLKIDYSEGEVYWNEINGRFSVKSFDTKREWSGDLWHYKTYCKVVGNIYERIE